MPLINRDTDYAVRAMLHLGHSGEVVSVSELAESEKAPEEFLRKIMQKLHRAGLVKSEQGPFGGYRVSKEPGRISILDILEAVQGPISLNACFEEPDVCGNVQMCALRKRLGEFQKEMNEWFGGIMLSDLLKTMPQKGTVKS